MKKLIKLAVLGAGASGLIVYMDKHGVPVLSNFVMKLPVKVNVDKPYEWMMKGIHFLESKGIEGI